MSSFLGATLLPGGSEAVLFGVLRTHPGLLWFAIGVATLGNTLGGMSSYLIGRALPDKVSAKGLAWVQRYGVFSLLFAWLPVVGDMLCMASGWLRLNALNSALFMALGKFVRYWVVSFLSIGL